MMAFNADDTIIADGTNNATPSGAGNDILIGGTGDDVMIYEYSVSMTRLSTPQGGLRHG